MFSSSLPFVYSTSARRRHALVSSVMDDCLNVLWPSRYAALPLTNHSWTYPKPNLLPAVRAAGELGPSLENTKYKRVKSVLVIKVKLKDKRLKH